MPPAGHLLFLSRQEKKAKEGDPKSATPSRREGANLRRCACGVRRGTHYAAAQLRSNNHGESVYASMRAPTRMPPRNHPAAGAATRGLKPPRAITALGPERRRRFAPRAPGRAQRWPVWMFDGFPSVRAEKRSAGGGMRAEGHACLRRLACRGCLNGAPQARSEFHGTPPARASQVAPTLRVGVTDSRVAFSLLTFFWRSKRK